MGLLSLTINVIESEPHASGVAVDAHEPVTVPPEREFTFYRTLPAGVAPEVPLASRPGRGPDLERAADFQVAAFRSQSAAQALVTDLVARGGAARIQTVFVGEAPLHRVHVASTSAADARAFAQASAVRSPPRAVSGQELAP